MRRRRSILTLAGIALAALATGALHRALPIPKRAELGEPFVPRPEVARLSSVGFHTALSDYYWLQAVQVVGGSLRPEQHGTLLGRYVDVVTTLDPWVDHPYRFAALWLTGSEEDVRHANLLLRRSLPHHPDEWRNRFYLGFNLFYFLEEEAEAADWLEEAARLPGAPAYLGGLAARLRAGAGGLEVAADLLRRMWEETDDPRRRAEYEKKLDEIETERRARLLDAARRRYREARGRDIRRVEDLVEGPAAVLAALPEEPHGWEWILHEKTGEIVSSYLKHRYRPHAADPEEKSFQWGWAKETERSAAAGEEQEGN